MLWGRGTASGFNGKPKDDFSMDGNVFTGYLGVDYRLQPNVLLGLAVAHSQGGVDLTLTSVLPYAHWSPRPGLGVWGLFGAGRGDLKLRDEAGRVKTDLEMLLGAPQEVLTWRRRWAAGSHTRTRSWGWGSKPGGGIYWRTRNRRSTNGARA